MAAVANPLQERAFAQPIVVEENSPLLKALSCVPFVGIVFSLTQETSLSGKITQTTDVPRLIELIDVKNQYIAANVIRNLINAAFVVTGAALHIFNPTFALEALVTALNIGAAGLNICRINKNKEIISELQSTGFRPEMQVS